MRIERELMRGAGPLAVLKLLQQREMYGYEMVDMLSKRTEGVLAMGQSTLYPMLYNLQAKGLVTSRRRQADSGRQRKYYALTKKGNKRLVAETKQWQAVVRAMVSLGVVADAAHRSSLAKGVPA